MLCGTHRQLNLTADLVFDSNGVSLHLSDNGIGFDIEKSHEGLGLQGIRERAETMGGNLVISSEQGKGTSISIDLPIDSGVHRHEEIS